MADYLDVLVLCSDPVNLRRTLNLAQELVHFEHVIRRSELPIRMRRVLPPTLEQLQREFARADEQGRRPSVFHFLGHGDDDGLYFENEHGEAQLVKGHELREALAQSPVQVALLNACWSATKRGVSLIEFLTREQVADAAIGHETPVADVSAIEFARQFYELVTRGKTVREACQRAANSLAEQGKFGAAEVELVGNGEPVLTAELTSGSHPCVIESGLPKFGHLPEPPVFYGRGEELMQLSRSLADAGLTGFALWGIGGIGKTALAKVAARRNAWRYEGAVWVDIRDAVQKTTAELLRLALCRLHPGAPDADPAFELARRLQAAPSLVVLDNLEDLPASEHDSLARFLQQVPKNGSRVLLTARVPLPAIERLSDVPSRRMTEGLDDWNGALFVQHVAQQKKCAALEGELREESSHPVGLCALVTQRLHGHPKMLELAVGVALQGRQALEQALVALPDDIEQQLAALLATSLQYLGEDGNRVLPLLGFFPTGSLTPEALEVVSRGSLREPNAQIAERSATMSDDDEPDLTWLSRGREQLVAAGLLDYHQAHDVYSFHQAILDEAHRRRPSDEISDAINGALLLHYAEYVEANHGDNIRLDRCFENAVVLMESFWSGRDGDSPLDAVLAGMTRKLGNYFQYRGLWRLGEQWHERAIELRRSSSHARDDAELATHLFHQGQVLASHSQPAAARNALNEALRLCEQTSDQRGIALALHELARIESAQGNPSEARRLLQRSLAILESLGDQRGLAASLHQLAGIESAQGNPSEARRLLQQSLAILESLGDQRGLAASSHELASIESAQGNPSEARRLLQQSLAILESLGDQRGLAASSHELASIESAQGNPSEARRLLQRSLAIKESLGEQRGLAASLHELARIESAQGNPSEARRLLQRSLAIKESLGDQRGLSASLHVLARIESAQGNPNEARRLLQRSLAIKESLGDQRGLSASLHELARIESAQRNPSEARRLLQRSLAIKESLGEQRGMAASLHQLAILESDQGNPSEARRLLQRSLAILESLGDQRGLAASLHVLAMIEAEAGNRDEARRLWERSIRIEESIGNVAGAAATKSNLAQLEAMDGRFERAIELASQAVQQLEQLGYAQVEDARGVLRDIEQFVAQGGASGEASSYAARLNQTLTAWQSLAPDERSARLASLTDPAEAVLALVAQGAVCWQQGDVAGCEAANAEAQTLATATQDAELIALVAALVEQLEAARSESSPAGSGLPAALKLLEQDNAKAALPLLEKCLADARAAEDPLAVATCQFYLGQAALMLDRPAEAVTALREALELATQAGQTDLIRAVQQVLTIATREANGP